MLNTSADHSSLQEQHPLAAVVQLTIHSEPPATWWGGHCSSSGPPPQTGLMSLLAKKSQHPDWSPWIIVKNKSDFNKWIGIISQH